MSKLRGDGDQIVNFAYKSPIDSDLLSMSKAYIYTPGYLYADIDKNSPSDGKITINKLSAIVYPTNPRYDGELITIHTTSSITTNTLVYGTDDYLIMRYTHVSGEETTSALISTTTSAGIGSSDVVVCKIKYTGTWSSSTSYVLNDTVTAVTPDGITQYRCTTAGTSGGSEPTWDTTFTHTTADNTVVWTAEAVHTIGYLDYDVDEVTKSTSFLSRWRRYKFDNNGSIEDEVGFDTIVQHGYKSFSSSTTVSIIFPLPFTFSIKSIICTPEIAADCNWRISNSSINGFTVTFSSSSSGKLYWEAKGV